METSIFINEVWRPVRGYEGLYEVSNFGRVKSLSTFRKGNEVIMKIRKQGNGYMYVHLSKNGKSKFKRVHRLVAEAFIPNPDNLLYINHKDRNPENNQVPNLEWCSHLYNVNYSVSRSIEQYSLDGSYIATFISTREAERCLGIDHSKISACCRGKKNYAGGFIWRYAG